MDQNEGIVYLVTNKINGKGYVGQTTISAEDRFESHCCSGVGLLNKAIKKYGRKSFSLKILEKTKNLKELNELEIKWMDLLNSFPPNGYNILRGGNPWLSLSEKQKDRTRKAFREMIQEQYTADRILREMWPGKQGKYNRRKTKWKTKPELDKVWFINEEIKRLRIDTEQKHRGWEHEIEKLLEENSMLGGYKNAPNCSGSG
uniref:Putative endonuclease n=1 Tax=viral metagenome TaxID=1070528 RepID=A0A6M3JYB4_9ZZZZ